MEFEIIGKKEKAEVGVWIQKSKKIEDKKREKNQVAW